MLTPLRLDTSHLPALLPILTTLLRDRSPLSIGSATVAFQAVCPTRLDLLHQQYRRLCRILVDVDEWGQVELMELLIRYARTMLPRPSEEEEMDKDLLLLLNSSEPLFQSRNPAVSFVLFDLPQANCPIGRFGGRPRILLPSTTPPQDSSPSPPSPTHLTRSRTRSPLVYPPHLVFPPGQSTS